MVSDKRFIDIYPQVTEVQFGREPSLFEIIRHYYESYDLSTDEAILATEKYITKWLDSND